MDKLREVSERAIKVADKLVLVAERLRDCEGLDSALISQAKEYIDLLEQTNSEHNKFCD